jgi:hypothetical protein
MSVLESDFDSCVVRYRPANGTFKVGDQSRIRPVGGPTDRNGDHPVKPVHRDAAEPGLDRL